MCLDCVRTVNMKSCMQANAFVRLLEVGPAIATHISELSTLQAGFRANEEPKMALTISSARMPPQGAGSTSRQARWKMGEYLRSKPPFCRYASAEVKCSSLQVLSCHSACERQWWGCTRSGSRRACGAAARSGAGGRPRRPRCPA